MKNISIIVAIAENNAIGKDNQLLWHISEDLKRFKRITSGKTVIMGKNTFISLPNGALPNRENIVISDDKNDRFERCTMAWSVDDAIEKCSDEENFIIGGGSIYKQFLPIADKLYLTLVHKDYNADTFFPEVNYDEWEETEHIDCDYDEKAGVSYSFIIYQRKQ